MNAFLSSVRDLHEAQIALAAGGEWIDLKEPGEGALGAVDPGEIRRVVRWMRRAHGEVPVSATIGDCWDDPSSMPGRVMALRATGVGYAKIGLYGANPDPALLQAVAECCARGPRIILVCFAEAPPGRDAIAALAGTGIAGMMLDTADKSAGSLTNILSYERLRTFVGDVRSALPLCGLAGSLTRADVPRLAPLRADYLGFRGALCDAGGRTASLSGAAVAAVRVALDRARTDVSGHQPFVETASNRKKESYRGMA